MRGPAARPITLLALVSLLFAITAASGSAAGPGRGHILGVVPHSAPRAAAVTQMGVNAPDSTQVPSFLGTLFEV